MCVFDLDLWSGISFLTWSQPSEINLSWLTFSVFAIASRNPRDSVPFCAIVTPFPPWPRLPVGAISPDERERAERERSVSYCSELQNIFFFLLFFNFPKISIFWQEGNSAQTSSKSDKLHSLNDNFRKKWKVCS